MPLTLKLKIQKANAFNVKFESLLRLPNPRTPEYTKKDTFRCLLKMVGVERLELPTSSL